MQDHREEDEEGVHLTLDDVQDVIEDDGQDGDEPMDEDDDDGDDGEQQQQAFEDTSLAAFYAHKDSVFHLSLHPNYPNPPLAFSGGADDKGRLWDTRTGEALVELGGHTDSVVAGGFSATGEYVATGGLDGKVRVWKLHPPPAGTKGFEPRAVEDGQAERREWGACQFVTNLEGPDEIVWTAWHPKGNVIAAGGSDATVWMWNLPAGNVMNVFSGHTAAVTCGRFTPDGKRLVTASEDGSLLVWDPRSTSALSKVSPTDTRFNMDAGITSLCLSPDSKLAIVGGAAGTIRIVNLANIEEGGAALVVGALEGHTEGESIEGLEFVDLLGNTSGTQPQAAPRAQANAANFVISAGTDGKAVVWDLSTGKMRCEVMHDDAITSMTLHGSGPIFSTSSADGTARTWDARTAANLAVHRGFTDGVLAVVAGPDDGYTQGAESGGVGAYVNLADSKGWKVIAAGDEGVSLVFRV